MSCILVRYSALFSGTKFRLARFLLHFRCSPAWTNAEFWHLFIASMKSTQNCDTKVVETGILFSQHSMFLINPLTGRIIHPLGDASLLRDSIQIPWSKSYAIRQPADDVDECSLRRYLSVDLFCHQCYSLFLLLADTLLISTSSISKGRLSTVSLLFAMEAKNDHEIDSTAESTKLRSDAKIYGHHQFPWGIVNCVW